MRGRLLPAVPLFFGEAQGRVIVSCTAENLDKVLKIADDHGVPCREIGRVTEAEDGFEVTGAGAEISVPVETVKALYLDTIPQIMEAPAQG